jgi:hypothetical protein
MGEVTPTGATQVSDELVHAGVDAIWRQQKYHSIEADVRNVLAAVLPLHEQQVRAAIDREVTDHAQREPMSSERLAQIRHDLGPGIGYAVGMSSTSHLRVACELLAEVDRARAEVVVAWEFNDAGQAAFDAEYATNGRLRVDLEELRRQLGEARRVNSDDGSAA